jgi:holliday junction DNA helicase RuvB
MSLIWEEVDEEEQEINPYKPQTLDDYIGQTELKRRLKIYMDAARATDQPLPHVLLAAHPGYGKSSLAILIAKYLEDPIFVVDLAGMSDTQFSAFWRRFPGGIVFLDEIHRATKKQLESLLTLLEDNYLASPSGYPIETPWLTAILATTEPERLPKALIERCQIAPEFSEYTDAEATQIVTQAAGRAGLVMPELVACGLGRASAGTPRLAVKLVKAYGALSKTMEHPKLEDVLDLCELDTDGLSKKHYAYLSALDRLDGLAGEKPLMNVLGLSSASALADLERVLVKRDMMTYTARGRALLPAGDEAIRGLRKTWTGRKKHGGRNT